MACRDVSNASVVVVMGDLGVIKSGKKSRISRTQNPQPQDWVRFGFSSGLQIHGFSLVVGLRSFGKFQLQLGLDCSWLTGTAELNCTAIVK